MCGLEGGDICDVLCQSGGNMSMFNGMCLTSETKDNFHPGHGNKVYSILFY